jgi:hypothetical protein
MTTPERPDGTGGPDPEEIALLRRLLDAPAEGHQESAVMEALEYTDRAASLAWRAAHGGPPVERFRVALQVAVDLLQGIELALAEDKCTTGD